MIRTTSPVVQRGRWALILIAVGLVSVSACSSKQEAVPPKVLSPCEVYRDAFERMANTLAEDAALSQEWNEAHRDLAENDPLSTLVVWVLSGGATERRQAVALFIREVEPVLPTLLASQAPSFAARPGPEPALEAFLGATDRWFADECDEVLPDLPESPPPPVGIDELVASLGR